MECHGMRHTSILCIRVVDGDCGWVFYIQSKRQRWRQQCAGWLDYISVVDVVFPKSSYTETWELMHQLFQIPSDFAVYTFA
jgi:hypothetical protein